MKYRQLTKEQFQELNLEFSKFLATQQIDKNEWEQLKNERPEIAEEELAIFSDLVWDDVLSKTNYIEHISEHHLNVFKCYSKEIVRIYVKCTNASKNFLKEDDFNWFLKNPLDETFEYYKASKKYLEERNLEIFKLIEMGGQISDGKLFDSLIQLID
ncbi:MAG: DUF6495 family protein [Lutibacter sp.]|uniref:DUF6495 family protein n=1 Tax=Lutibacter sp. TaxID=1925666 RepID=UPI00299F2F42|nr:DUF6495 family protein [Lutibacter sp.]MDX1828147.1 DUF6495 family protein [Lutibacter sp.]